MRQFIVLGTFFVLIAAIDVVGRFFRFRRNPRAWSARTLAISALVWAVALMIFAQLGQNGLEPIEIGLAIVFGALYFAIVWSVGRAIVRGARPLDRRLR